MILFCRGFRRLRAASDFPSDGKVTKGSPGDAADGLRLRIAPPRSIGPLSPGPPLRGTDPAGLWSSQRRGGVGIECGTTPLAAGAVGNGMCRGDGNKCAFVIVVSKLRGGGTAADPAPTGQQRQNGGAGRKTPPWGRLYAFRAPVGPEGNVKCTPGFHAPDLPTQRAVVCPPYGGPGGKANMGTLTCPSEPSPGSVLPTLPLRAK